MKYTDTNKHIAENSTAQQVETGLNIICPECQLEELIKDGFDSKEHFMTAMGGVIHHLDDRFIQEMNDMISINGVTTIRLIVHPNCELLKNAMTPENNDLNEAERLLRKIYYVHKEDLEAISDHYERRVELAKLNLILQGAYLKRNPFLDLKMGAGLLDLKGAIYHSASSEFEEVFTTSK